MDITSTRNLAIELMTEHGIFQAGWRFIFDNSRRRFGCCSYGPRTISLSKYLVVLNTVEEVRNTILHEIAHAMVGHSHGHDWTWKSKARSIGCSGDRCYSATEVVTPPTPLVGTCPSCGHTIGRHKRSRRTTACSNCCNLHSFGRFDARFTLVWTRRTV